MRRSFSSRISIIICVAPADVCAEKLSCAEIQLGAISVVGDAITPSAICESTLCTTTDFPTPEPPQSIVGFDAPKLARSMKAAHTVSTVGTRMRKNGSVPLYVNVGTSDCHVTKLGHGATHRSGGAALGPFLAPGAAFSSTRLGGGASARSCTVPVGKWAGRRDEHLHARGRGLPSRRGNGSP